MCVWLKQSAEGEMLTVFGRNTRRDLMQIIQMINTVQNLYQPAVLEETTSLFNPTVTGGDFNRSCSIHKLHILTG